MMTGNAPVYRDEASGRYFDVPPQLRKDYTDCLAVLCVDPGVMDERLVVIRETPEFADLECPNELFLKRLIVPKGYTYTMGQLRDLLIAHLTSLGYTAGHLARAHCWATYHIRWYLRHGNAESVSRAEYMDDTRLATYNVDDTLAETRALCHDMGWICMEPKDRELYMGLLEGDTYISFYILYRTVAVPYLTYASHV